MSDDGLPHFMRGTVVKGFGRGSKELGVPTANLPLDDVRKLPDNIAEGVYFGFGKIDDGAIYKMVMNIGWNPFYKNEERSLEIHFLHVFENDFYGCTLSIVILGYIRPELDFKSVETLIRTIKSDIEIANEKLDEPQYSKYRKHEFFSQAIKTTVDSYSQT